MGKVDNRKDLLLLLLFAPGLSGEEGEPVDGRTRLMKLLYLLQADYQIEQVLNLRNSYTFQTYHYGPFSKDVYDDIVFLENVGLIKTSSTGLASPVDQDEGEKVVADISIGETNEDVGVVFEEERFGLTETGIRFVKQELIPNVPGDVYSAIRELKGKFAGVPLTSLLRYVYSRHPEFAEKTRLEYLVS